MFFKPKCSCGKSSHVVFTNVIPTMAGDVKLQYCIDCHKEKVQEETEREERNKITFEIEQKERKKQRRYEYLKREVELRELEEKAKVLGIE